MKFLVERVKHHQSPTQDYWYPIGICNVNVWRDNADTLCSLYMNEEEIKLVGIFDVTIADYIYIKGFQQHSPKDYEYWHIRCK